MWDYPKARYVIFLPFQVEVLTSWNGSSLSCNSQNRADYCADKYTTVQSQNAVFAFFKSNTVLSQNTVSAHFKSKQILQVSAYF